MKRIVYSVLRSAFYVLLLTFCISAFHVYAQGGPVTDDQVNAVAKKLNCPVCENIPLDVCDTQACVQWRDLIRQKLADGETPEQIIAYFHETYGDRVLQEPPRRGFTGMLWILPVVGVVLGAVIFWLALRSMSPRLKAASDQAQSGEPAPTLQPDTQDEYRRRLERELEEIK